MKEKTDRQTGRRDGERESAGEHVGTKLEPNALPQPSQLRPLLPSSEKDVSVQIVFSAHLLR